MDNKLPIVDLNNADRLWLQEAYDILKTNKRPEQRVIWSKLYGKIPNNFSTISLDDRLIDPSGENITILGIIALERDYSIIEKANKLFFAAKDILVNNPKRSTISIAELANLSGLDPVEAGIIFYLTSFYGHFYQSASLAQNGIAPSEINIGSDSQYFQQYLYFNGVEELISKYLEQKSRNEETSKIFFEGKENVMRKNEETFSMSPIFKSRIEKTNEGICFVLMPFKNEWSQRVYNFLIKKNVEEVGLQCLRADNMTGPIIIEDIWTQINQAGIIIADVTGKNPNVMYELGIVHTLGKPAILITQEIEKIPFDFTHLRHYQYSDNFESFNDFGNRLKDILRENYRTYYPHYRNLL